MPLLVAGSPMSTMYCTARECATTMLHAHCMSCGTVNMNASPICSHHGTAYADDWAVGNRIMCGLVHRKIQPPPCVLADPPPVEWGAGWDAA